MARSRAMARLNWVSQGQRCGRCRVRRRAERVSRPAKEKNRRRRVLVVMVRGITQVVHFTTVSGAIGILASNAIKSRARLPKDKYISHVYRPNSQTRKDELWLDYVNLSTERINDWMFQHSERWHAAELRAIPGWFSHSTPASLPILASSSLRPTISTPPVCERKVWPASLESSRMGLKAVTAHGMIGQTSWMRGPLTDRRRFCILASYRVSTYSESMSRWKSHWIRYTES